MAEQWTPIPGHQVRAQASLRDSLTGLYNRQFFIERLTADFHRQAADPDLQFAVLLLGLDRFKLINDSFGHRAGDAVLIEAATRLRGCVQDEAALARLGGDEFALLLEGFDDPADIAGLATRIIEALRKPMRLHGHDVLASASVGAAQATDLYRIPEEILRDADIAMVEAKRRHTGFLVFDDSMRDDPATLPQLRTELRQALERSEFYLEYQPIFDLVSREMKGLEALIRWRHPDRGALSPGAFVGLAEEMGLIRPIGGRVLRDACRQMQEWHKSFPGAAPLLSVNISGYQLTDIRFIPELHSILKETRLAPSALLLEVTENVLLPAAEPILAVIARIKALGVKVALDDFGTGFSSLSYLDRYPVDAIKIDRSFVDGIPDREKTMSILQAIIDLAGTLGLDVTAEGVETDAQVQALLAMGCRKAQGFYLSAPLPAEAIREMLRRRN